LDSNDIGRLDHADFDRWTRPASRAIGDRVYETGDVWDDCAFESERVANVISTRRVPSPTASGDAPWTSSSSSFTPPETADVASTTGSIGRLVDARAAPSAAVEARSTATSAMMDSDLLADQPVHGSDLVVSFGHVGALDGKRRVATPVHVGHVALLIVVSVLFGWLVGTTARDVVDNAGPEPYAPEAIKVAGVQDPVRIAQRAVAGANLNGWWHITNEVESARDAEYPGVRLAYRLHLQQRGDYVRGRGHQVAENGHQLLPGDAKPIAVQGAVIGDRLALAFAELHTPRVNRGTFVFRLTSDGALQGSFESDAAGVRSRLVARRAAGP
jgi:hypothetical protein